MKWWRRMLIKQGKLLLLFAQVRIPRVCFLLQGERGGGSKGVILELIPPFNQRRNAAHGCREKVVGAIS